jgi:hypothetical protein
MTTEERAALLEEYEKAIDLWIAEGRSAWELVSIFMVVQVGLISVLVLLYNQASGSMGSIRFLLVSLAGVISSFAWFFILYRARMRRENWFFLGLRMERRLFISRRFRIFAVEHAVRIEKKALEYFRNDDEIRFRDQRYFEKAGALRVAHWSTFVIGIGWLILLIIFVTFRIIYTHVIA